jgi:hypothetical protein
VLVRFHVSNKDVNVNIAVIKVYRYVLFLLKIEVTLVLRPHVFPGKVGVNENA